MKTRLVRDGACAIAAQWLLNDRPRKVLGRKFPAEAMREALAEGAMIVLTRPEGVSQRDNGRYVAINH